MMFDSFGNRVPSGGGDQHGGCSRYALAQTRRHDASIGGPVRVAQRQRGEEHEQAQGPGECDLKEQSVIGSAHRVVSAEHQHMGR
jgi:hypothetical protein